MFWPIRIRKSLPVSVLSGFWRAAGSSRSRQSRPALALPSRAGQVRSVRVWCPSAPDPELQAEHERGVSPALVQVRTLGA
jgi:hypothetical protein